MDCDFGFVADDEAFAAVDVADLPAVAFCRDGHIDELSVAVLHSNDIQILRSLAKRNRMRALHMFLLRIDPNIKLLNPLPFLIIKLKLQPRNGGPLQAYNAALPDHSPARDAFALQIDDVDGLFFLDFADWQIVHCLFEGIYVLDLVVEAFCWF